MWLIALNFCRIAVAVAVLILYLPHIATMFRARPFPRRDYLLAGIILTWASAISFAVWNAAGRSFDVETSVFISPIAGFFSLLLVLGGVFHVLAPDMARGRNKLIAVVIGALIAAALMFGPALIGRAQAETKSEWFKSLKIPRIGGSCCDVADCHQTVAEQRDVHWWALSRVRNEMIQVPNDRVLETPSYDGLAYLCESQSAHVYCFVKPGGGF